MGGVGVSVCGKCVYLSVCACRGDEGGGGGQGEGGVRLTPACLESVLCLRPTHATDTRAIQ